MSISYAVLLDGGFLRHKLGTRNAPVDAARISTFTDQVARLPCLVGMRLHRIYFYDAKPLEAESRIPLGGGIVDFGASTVASRNEQIQSALIRQPFFALRIGELFHEGWRLRKKVLEQRGPILRPPVQNRTASEIRGGLAYQQSIACPQA